MTLLFIALVMFGCMAIHEGGHWLAAWYYGEKLTFRFDWDELGELKIPSFAWDMPATFTPEQKKIVAFAGFGAEVAAAFLFCLLGVPWEEPFALFAMVHLLLYPWYAGPETDYRYIGG